ncbi:MAG TPA: hypothetical protein VFI47_04580 [Acidimicrobiales bacterium]|nr:hypothetical protein [Acidimicrobiales bacterium]
MAGFSASSGRTIAVAGIATFMAGCWVGMGAEGSTGDAYCVVTDATAWQYTDHGPGDIVDEPSGGCLPGEPEVCGRWSGSGEEREFESDRCPD